jgi:hypothetical protein
VVAADRLSLGLLHVEEILGDQTSLGIESPHSAIRPLGNPSREYQQLMGPGTFVSSYEVKRNLRK